jgi:hypothetical protein
MRSVVKHVNADFIFKNIILDFVKECIKIAIESIIVLPLSLVPKLDQRHY